MAFNEQNREDAYKFFVLTFNAVPGAKHAVDVVKAYNDGLTTEQIIAIYTSKDAFKAIYADSLTSKEFAEKLVANVASATASVAAKNAAVADIVKAMDGGVTKAGVIYQVLGNLSNKPVTDLDWGTTVAQVQNKVAVAKALTEGAKALDTTDVATLQAAIKDVTQDAATVQQALDKSSVIATKLGNLAAANKAKAEFASSLDLTGDGKADGLTSTTVETALTNALSAKATAISAGFNSATTNEARESAWKVVSTADAADVAAKQNTVATATATATGGAAPAVTAAEIAQMQALRDAVTNTVKTQQKAAVDLAGAAAKISAQSAAATVTIAGTTVADVASGDKVAFAAGITSDVNYDVAKKAFVLTAAQEAELAGLTNANLKADLTTYLSALNASVKTALTAKDAATAYTSTFTDATAPLLAGANKTTLADVTFAGTNAKVTAATPVLTAQEALKTSLQTKATHEKAYSEYQALATLNTKLQSLDKAIADAKKSFTDAGLPVPVEVTSGLVAATGESDTFLPVGEVASISGFGLVGKDNIYVGSNYVKGADLTTGDDAKLEVFFKANGSDTDVYVEQKVFGSSVNGAANGNKDIFKITLTGVAADKLVLNEGFITLA